MNRNAKSMPPGRGRRALLAALFLGLLIPACAPAVAPPAGEEAQARHDAAWEVCQAAYKATPRYDEEADAEHQKEYAEKLGAECVQARAFLAEFPDSPHVSTARWSIIRYAQRVGMDHAEGLAMAEAELAQPDLTPVKRLNAMLARAGFLRRLDRVEEAREVVDRMRAVRDSSGLTANDSPEQAERLLNARQVGDPLPLFAAPDLAGATVTPDALRGKIAVIHFRTIGSGTSSHALDQIREMLTAHGPDTIAAVTVLCEPRDSAHSTPGIYGRQSPEPEPLHTAEQAAAYAAEMGITWTCMHDAAAPRLWHLFGLWPHKLPHTIIADRSGRIVFTRRSEAGSTTLIEAAQAALSAYEAGE